MEYTIVRFLNGVASANAVTEGVSVMFSSVLIFLLGCAVVVLGLRCPPAARRSVFAEVLVTIIVSYLVSQSIGVAVFRERPFVHHADIQALIGISPSLKSFP